MNYILIKELLDRVQQFETENNNNAFYNDIEGFLKWAAAEVSAKSTSFVPEEPVWEGKANGRSPESVISTLLVHLNRYAKTYSRSAIFGSAFSTQEEFIYLIVLQAYGALTKMDLIRKNVQDKPAGMLVINRLLQQGWVEQVDSEIDKRSKVLKITSEGAATLGRIKEKINRATQIVCGNLVRTEQMELIRLLKKLEDFHHPIFLKNIERETLLDRVSAEYLSFPN